MDGRSAGRTSVAVPNRLRRQCAAIGARSAGRPLIRHWRRPGHSVNVTARLRDLLLRALDASVEDRRRARGRFVNGLAQLQRGPWCRSGSAPATCPRETHPQSRWPGWSRATPVRPGAPARALPAEPIEDDREKGRRGDGLRRPGAIGGCRMRRRLWRRLATGCTAGAPTRVTSPSVCATPSSSSSKSARVRSVTGRPFASRTTTSMTTAVVAAPNFGSAAARRRAQ